MRLVYLSPVPWESFAQRPHKFVEWFRNRTNAPVLWVDPYPTRLPNWTDLRRLRSTVETGRFSSTPSWLRVLRPRGLPIEPVPGSGWINRPLWRRQLDQIDEFANASKTALVIGKPSLFALEILKILTQCRSIYDAMDDFPAFYRGVSRSAMKRRERQMAERVDLVWASSSALKTSWDRLHGDVRLVHNGLDLSAVQAIQPMHKVLGKRVFGYVGTIASWFDWEWLCALAEARPDDEVHLIGPVFEHLAGELPSNVKLFPACDHASALRTMTRFHVGIIPFKNNALTASVDPIKYYEYRVLGLPVMSTDFGEMGLRTRECGVFISRSVNDVSALAEAAMQFGHDVNVASDFALRNSWQARFDSAGLL